MRFLGEGKDTYPNVLANKSNMHVVRNCANVKNVKLGNLYDVRTNLFANMIPTLATKYCSAVMSWIDRDVGIILVKKQMSRTEFFRFSLTP
jgi:hypothetical protein